MFLADQQMRQPTHVILCIAQTNQTSLLYHLQPKKGPKVPTRSGINRAITSQFPKPTTNPYDKSRVIKCYMYGKEGHWSNECPKQRQTLLVDFDGDDDEEIMTEEFNEDVDEYTEVEGEPVTFVVQRILCSPKVQDTSHHNNIFQSKCSIN